MTAFLQLVAMIQGPAFGLVASIPAFIAAYTALERLNELEKLPREQADMSLVQPSFRIEKITFSDVTFEYETGRQTLSHANFVFERGKMTALVGETGCGKTTVMRLLLGWYLRNRGRLLYRIINPAFRWLPLSGNG